MHGVVSFGPFRLFLNGLFRQAEPDHVRNDHASARRLPPDAFIGFSPYPKKITAWPLRPGSLMAALRHVPFTKSKTTTSSRATQ